MQLPEKPLVLFDGTCNLCNRGVQFVVRRDPKRRFVFASLQSELGSAVTAEAFGATEPPDSIVVWNQGRVTVRSDAALLIARGLRFPWPLLAGLRIVPAPWRDRLYDLVARNRYQWFGQRDECWIPTENLRQRFVDL